MWKAGVERSLLLSLISWTSLFFSWVIILNKIYSCTLDSLCSSMYLSSVNLLASKVSKLKCHCVCLTEYGYSVQKFFFMILSVISADVAWIGNNTVDSNLTMFFVIKVHPFDLDYFQTLRWRRRFVFRGLHYALRVNGDCLFFVCLELSCLVSSKSFLFFASFSSPKTNECLVVKALMLLRHCVIHSLEYFKPAFLAIL